MTKPLPDGDHLLPCGATFTVRGGEPVELHVGEDAYTPFGACAALGELEEATEVWFDFDAFDDWEADDERGDAPFPLTRLHRQPTHRFFDDRGSHLVWLGPDPDADEASTAPQPRTWALPRASFQDQDRDLDGWPPYLRDGVWIDSFREEPMLVARIEPLSAEAQA